MVADMVFKMDVVFLQHFLISKKNLHLVLDDFSKKLINLITQ